MIFSLKYLRSTSISKSIYMDTKFTKPHLTVPLCFFPLSLPLKKAGGPLFTSKFYFYLPVKIFWKLCICEQYLLRWRWTTLSFSTPQHTYLLFSCWKVRETLTASTLCLLTLIRTTIRTLIRTYQDSYQVVTVSFIHCSFKYSHIFYIFSIFYTVNSGP